MILEILIFIGFLWICWLIWEWLSTPAWGRAIQIVFVSVIYSLSLSVFPLAVVSPVGVGLEAYSRGSYAGVTIASVAIPLMAPIGLLSLIPWNSFCHWTWIKVGVRLPQTERLGTVRRYFEDASGRRF